MAEEVGVAYVRLLPSMQGFSGAVSKEMSGAGIDGAVGKAGAQAGSKFSENAKKAVGRGMMAAGAAVAGFSAKASASFAGFQTQMLEVFTLLPGITSQEMGKMTDDVKKFAKDFGVLPDKVVPALYQAISAGVPKDNVFAFLETAQKAAKGGVTQLETAVDGISSVVNAYGSDVIGAAKASDLMFTAVKLGKTNFEQLSSSLFNVVPAAAAAGVKFEEVTAGIAALTAQGTPTSVATTQMRQAIVELTQESGKSAKAFKEISGKSFPQFIKSGGTLQQALKMMEKDAKANGKSLLDMFGSVEAGQAALALTGKGTEKFSDSLKEMRNSTGATDAAFATMNSGISAKVDKLRAKFAVFSLDVGEKIQSVGPQWIGLGLTVAGKSTLLTTAASAVGGAFGKMASKAAFGIGKAAAATATGAAKMTASLAAAAGRAVAATATWAAQAAAAAARATASMVAAAARQVAAWAMLAARSMAAAARVAAAWLISMGPIAIVAAAVAGLVIVVVKNWDKIKRAITGAANAVLGFLRRNWPLILGILTGPFGLAVLAIAKNWDRIVSTAKGVPGKIKSAFSGMASLLVNTGKDLIQGFINGIKNAAGGILSAIKDSVTDKIPGWIKKPLGIGSPSKLTAQYGKWLVEGMAIGIRANAKKVADAQKELQDKLKARIDQVRDMAKEIQGAFKVDLSATETGIDGAGEDLVTRLSKQAAEAQKFAAVIKQLRKGGLSESLVQQLVAQGPSALASAQEIAANIGLVNKLAAQIDKAGRSLAVAEVKLRTGVNLDTKKKQKITIPKMHSGGVVPGSGEKLRILQGGEGVFTPEQMRALGAGAARGGSVGVLVRLDPNGADRRLVELMRYLVRVEAGGDAQAFFRPR